MNHQPIFSPLEEAIKAYRRGNLDRRGFLGRAARLGVATGTAQMLAIIWSNDAWAQSSKTSAPPTGAFDYIVVGSGSGGATAASRLALKSDARVLVLESGGTDDIPEIHDPRGWPASLATRATKNFNTTPQAQTANRVHVWPRGNAVGGSSDINAMIFARGHRTDFDAWAYEGCVGWDYASVLPYYKALEDWEGGASEFRGAGGPLPVTQPRGAKRHEGAVAFMKGCSELGFKETSDFNGKRMEGQAWVNMTIKDSKRQSTGVAFLKPAMARPNLTVITDAPVVRLVFEGKRCVGVSYLHNGQPQTVRANNEVILAAGALESPKILMLSGIGPEGHLKAMNVPVVVDLPGVGQNLNDHLLGAGCNYEAKAPVPVSNYNHSEVYMWAKSRPQLVAPDINVLYLSVPFATEAFKMDIKEGHGYSILSGVVRPYSRGTIRLASNNPADPPVIDPNYLTAEQDWRAFVAATELARDIGNSRAYDGIRGREVLPGPTLKRGDKAQMREFLAKATNTFFHPTSTCKMGVDAMAVVDPQLRVIGVDGLRVADASVMPSITTSNTDAPSIMIGWRCGQMLLGE